MCTVGIQQFTNGGLSSQMHKIAKCCGIAATKVLDVLYINTSTLELLHSFCTSALACCNVLYYTLV